MSIPRGALWGVLVVVVALAAGSAVFSRTVALDADDDWRAASRNLRRAGRPGLLAAGPGALVHFHDVAGGIGSVELTLSSREADTVEVLRDGRSLFEVPLGPEPRRVVVPAEAAARDVDVELRTRGERRGGVLVHGIRMERLSAYRALEWVSLVCGLAVFAWLMRVGETPAAAALAGSAAALVATGALAAAADPTTLTFLRPGTRATVQSLAVAAVAAWTVARGHLKGVPLLGALALTAGLYAPVTRYGLVYDDFLWARPWTFAEVASTFVGSEDPTDVSGSYYRPWASTSHAVDHLVWGFRPAAYHATNMGLLVAAALMARRLFLRAGFGAPAALAGILVWMAHPLSASAVAWISQRTDTLLAIFYLAALAAFAARPFTRGSLVAAVALSGLALGAKEHATTIPLAAALLVFARFRDDPDRRRRWTAVRLAALLVLAYIPLWIALFPDKLMNRTGAAAGWGGFDPGRTTDWLRLLPALYGPIVAPTGYAAWWNTKLQDWSPAYLSAVAVVVLVLGAWIASGAVVSRRLLLLGMVWPLVVVAPLLGLRGIDLYRGGLLVALGAGWLAALAAARLGEARRLHVAMAVAVAVAFLAPITAASAAAWGPDGFYRGMVQASNREMTGWLASLPPHCRAYFWKQVAEDEHRRGEAP